MKQLWILCILLAGLSNERSNAQEVSDAVLTSGFTSFAENQKLDRCDVHKADAFEDENGYTRKYSYVFLPHFSVQYRILKSVKRTNGVPIDIEGGIPFNPDLPVKDMVDAVYRVVKPPAVEIKLLETQLFDRSRFATMCIVQGLCTCLKEGLSTQTTLAKTMTTELSKYQLVIAEYVAKAFEENKELIEKEQKEELYQSLVSALGNNNELTNRIVDIVLAKIAVAKDSKLVTVISEKLADDKTLREVVSKVVVEAIAKQKK